MPSSIAFSLTPLTAKEWRSQRETYLTRRRGPSLDLGFATFYLNRGNRSGIVKDGGEPMGGIKQSGEWKIDARFNRDGLAERVQEISAFGDRVSVLQLHAHDGGKHRCAHRWAAILHPPPIPPTILRIASSTLTTIPTWITAVSQR
jgi:hypothetical protein